MLFSLLISTPALSQEPNGKAVLEKAIDYHDPKGTWENFKAEFTVTMQTPNSGDRTSHISFDFAKQLFYLDVSKDKDSYSFKLEKDDCQISLNGSTTISNEDTKRLRLNCERAKMYKNYYTYLYGLPMKLKDPGTQIHDKVERKTFKGKEYLVIKATYDTAIGDDTWYFYFDPTTYAMEVYQFYHDQSKNDGEYILLSEIEEVNGIKMPKVRKWYYNKDDTFLGTDILN